MVQCGLSCVALLHFVVAQGINIDKPATKVLVNRPAQNMEEVKAKQRARWQAEAEEKQRLKLAAQKTKARKEVQLAREVRAKAKMDADASLRTEIQAQKKEQNQKRLAELAEHRKEEEAKVLKRREEQAEQRRKDAEKAPLKARWQAILAEKKQKAEMSQDQRLEHIQVEEDHLREEKLAKMAIEEKLKAKSDRDEAFRQAQQKRRRMEIEGRRKSAEATLRKVEWAKKKVAKDQNDREIESRRQQAMMEPKVQQEDEDADVIYVNVHRANDQIRLKVQRSARFRVLFDVICHRFHLLRPTVSFMVNGTPLNEQDTPDKVGFKGDEAIMVQGGVDNM